MARREIAMTPERMAEGAPVAADLARMRVECVYCDDAGEPLQVRAVPVLALLAAQGRRVFAARRA